MERESHGFNLPPSKVVVSGDDADFPGACVATSEQVSYDVTKDGQRFLINTQVKNVDTHPMTVILNWDAEMKKK
jgi:hypothetical protein